MPPTLPPKPGDLRQTPRVRFPLVREVVLLLFSPRLRRRPVGPYPPDAVAVGVPLVAVGRL